MTSDRKAWKNEFAQKKYGQSYDSLCHDRKEIIDQMWLLKTMEEEDKKNPKKGLCR
jgi:hypothetical protein